MKVSTLIHHLGQMNPDLEVQFMSELHEGLQLQDTVQEVAHTTTEVILIGTERDIDGKIERRTPDKESVKREPTDAEVMKATVDLNNKLEKAGISVRPPDESSVLVPRAELEELKEKAWKYDELNK